MKVEINCVKFQVAAAVRNYYLVTSSDNDWQLNAAELHLDAMQVVGFYV